jgi:hypothetical protein
MNGAAQAPTSSQSRIPKTSHAVALSPPPAPASVEFGLSSLVVNQGSYLDG